MQHIASRHFCEGQTVSSFDNKKKKKYRPDNRQQTTESTMMLVWKWKHSLFFLLSFSYHQRRFNWFLTAKMHQTTRRKRYKDSVSEHGLNYKCRQVNILQNYYTKKLMRQVHIWQTVKLLDSSSRYCSSVKKKAVQ